MADILIVDDDDELADTLAELLAGCGHEVHVARNGRDGLSALDERALPDVVILDIEMPVLDGPGMANQMFVRDCGKERIPIVLISGYVDLPRIAGRVGTPYFAPKPCSLDTLLGLLERALSERTPPAPRAPPEATARGVSPSCRPSTPLDGEPEREREAPPAQAAAEDKTPNREGE